MMRSVFTFYSDDIRQEVGNKLTYVGAYSGSMHVTDFPVTLPKLCVSVFVVYDKEEPIKNMKIDIRLGGDILASTSFSPGDVPENGNVTEDHPGVIQANFLFSPLEISEPKAIRVNVTADESDLAGLPLNIMKEVPPAPQNLQ